ncbi:TetR/AcrR family transcriptional regulator [Salaquimonas pukyongi]|uniref:TetR/AcrR family transcriptional regulator n=1 Tax=Salaquimonas pukyongi TaxID=2712698 RepID=UPI00096B77C0|nr:TetR/AcrR family transcriptional regulator [Salaquimonas pukyongi]
MKNRTDRERRIFEAAYKVLSRKGFKSASMLAIAKAAGASNETMYNWYGNKQGLLAAMIKDNADQVAADLEDFAAKVPDKDTDSIARLEKFGCKLLDLLTGERSVLLNRAAAADVADGGLLGRLLSEHGRSRMVALISGTVEAAQAAGKLRVHDRQEITEIYLALLLGDIQIRRVIGVTRAPPPEAIAVHSQRVIELLLDLFGAEKAAAN